MNKDLRSSSGVDHAVRLESVGAPVSGAQAGAVGTGLPIEATSHAVRTRLPLNR